MMRVHRAGFTLVEIMLVAVLGGLVMAAVYQTLIVQEQSYRAGGARISSQDGLRTALGVLEAELREVVSIDEGVAGGSDISAAGDHSISFRAPRSIGFVCKQSPSEKWMVTWAVGDDFAAEDSLLLFVDDDSLRYQDDSWATAYVSTATASTDSDCVGGWADATLQKVQLSGHDLVGVTLGSPVRAFERITYGLYQFDGVGWGLGRQKGTEDPRLLVGPLASQDDDGLLFVYFDENGDTTDVAGQIARIEIGVKNLENTAADVEQMTLKTNLYLRNN